MSDTLTKSLNAALAVEREACAALVVRNSQLHANCDYRGPTCPETGEVPCGNRNGCLCDEIADHGDALAKAIRERV